MGEDQDAAGAGGVDEADRGDGLAGAGRVLEPEAAVAPGSSAASATTSSSSSSTSRPRTSPAAPRPRPPRRRLERLRLPRPRSARRRRIFVLVRGSASALALRSARRELDRVVLGGDLLLGQELGQGAGERVDLMRVELGAVAERRRLLADQPFEAEQQREVAAPLERRLLGARRRSRPARHRGPGGGRCRAAGLPAPRHRAGRAHARTPAARSMSALLGAAPAATSVVLAIEGFGCLPPADQLGDRRASRTRATGSRESVPREL